MEKKLRRPAQDKATKSTAAHPVRCPCGSLLARLVPGGVELKCRRCKRQVVIPLASENELKGMDKDADAKDTHSV
jgi:phage FluMu protein Com